MPIDSGALATQLGRGASFEEVADILGNSPAIVGKHYGKWSPAIGVADELATILLPYFAHHEVTAISDVHVADGIHSDCGGLMKPCACGWATVT